jgi:hypothetical protein
MVAEVNKIFLVCQPRQLVHRCLYHQGLIISDPEDVDRDGPWNISNFNQLTWLTAQEDFVKSIYVSHG